MSRGAMRGYGGTPPDARRRATLEREKRELRSERDRLLVELAESLGTDGLARSLGTSGATAETMVHAARSRMLATPPRISARRVSGRHDRWAEADRHFEALGRDGELPGDAPSTS